jgi:hypothetical protein
MLEEPRLEALLLAREVQFLSTQPQVKAKTAYLGMERRPSHRQQTCYLSSYAVSCRNRELFQSPAVTRTIQASECCAMKHLCHAIGPAHLLQANWQGRL